MTKISEIYAYIDKIAPFDSAMDFDNCGLLCGNKHTEAKRVLVCLDITAPVIEEAKRLGCNLIISHHPIIFKPLYSLESSSVPYKLASSGITAICAHTNLDISPVGTNAQLAKMLDLSDIEMIENEPIAIGCLKHEMSPLNFARHVKERLGCKGLRYLSGNKNIKTVGVCTGAGGDMLCKISDKTDAFITGEIKHHELISASAMNITVADIGHYRSEFIVCAPLASILSNRFKNVEFIVSESDTELTEYMV